MTLMQVRAKMRRIRAELEELEEESGELNLVPYLDISTNVVMFLLLTVTFSAALAQVAVKPPSLSTGDSGGGGGETKALNLQIAVSKTGFVVTGQDPVLTPDAGGRTISKKGAEYDWDALTSVLQQVKASHENDEAVGIGLEPDMPYELLVKVADTARGDPKKPLFPRIALTVGE
jgi:biopolymer transport protein ExbD